MTAQALQETTTGPLELPAATLDDLVEIARKAEAEIETLETELRDIGRLREVSSFDARSGDTNALATLEQAEQRELEANRRLTRAHAVARRAAELIAAEKARLAANERAHLEAERERLAAEADAALLEVQAAIDAIVEPLNRAHEAAVARHSLGLRLGLQGLQPRVHSMVVGYLGHRLESLTHRGFLPTPMQHERGPLVSTPLSKKENTR